jgi:hypothetical protein
LVVDPSGKRCAGDRQVVISAQAASPPEAASEVVAATRTDAGGYFSTLYPLGKFIAAEGTVDGRPAGPIQLDIEGFFPERVVLALELPDDSEGSCTDCTATSTVPRDPDGLDLVIAPETYTDDIGARRCVDFTKPNRVLEEFDYHVVVRRTEPEIRGLTITEPPKIGLDSLVNILNPQILSFVIESQPAVDLFSIGKSANPGSQAARSALPSAPTIPVDRPAAPGSIDLSNEQALALVALASARPELEHLSEVVGLASLKLAESRPDDDDGGPRIDLSSIQIDAQIAKALATDPDGFSLVGLAKAEIVSRKNDLIRLLDLIKRPTGGRGRLTCDNPVDWDDEPTIYQACTIAHGHMLHFKQQWMADGYSMGEIIYSLPLAPCQKKQIAIVDWDRRESAARRESLEEQETLSSYLSRDRDISEIAQASVVESMLGGSKSTTSSIAGGTGGSFVYGAWAAVAGMGGGASGASSTAWQQSARSAAAASMQQLRDFTMQGATAVRSQRATVVQTVRQGEAMRVQTEVVANHNHCHSITIEYLEVLRHFLVRHHLADVQECLLVPLLMARFDSAKARRWQESLRRYLRKPKLAPGFDALQRIADNYIGSDMPTGAYAEESLVYLDGYLRIKFRIQRPIDNDDGSYLAASWTPLTWLGITSQEWWQNYLENQQERDRVFAEMLGPRIAEDIVNGLRIYAVDENDNETLLPIDLTLVSDFSNDTPLYASLRLNDALPAIRRDAVKFIKIDTKVDTPGGAQNIDTMLPTGSKVVVDSGQMGYRTDHIAHDLFRQSRILNDLSGSDGVLIYTPLSRDELRRPREEDKEVANALLKHLNDHMEYYHRVIWWHMDSQRRHMLLDGFIAPNSGGRSVASVVENRLIGIFGNCLVMPVARGFHLDPTFQQNADNPIDLLEHYQPTTPVAPVRIAVPTKGVFAEAVMGACNSCEKKDESRFWRWEESPCPDEPTPIQAVSTASRRAEPPDMTPQPFPQPIVAFQNVPPAADPQGFAGLLQTLSNPNLFRDVTGLTENQRNALGALQSAFDTAKFFGDKAADLNLQGAMRQDVDKALDKINEAHQSGAISAERRSQLTEAALRGMVGGGTQAPAQPMSVDQMEQLTSAAGAHDASLTHTLPGETFSVDAKPPAILDSLTARCTIILPEHENLPDARAFFPSRQDKTGVIEFNPQVRNLPPNGSYRWIPSDPAAMTVDTPVNTGANPPTTFGTKVKGLLPGRSSLDFVIKDQWGTVVESIKLQLSIPQFVTIDEDAALFNGVLTALGLDILKDQIIQEARKVSDLLLSKANVRTIWRISPFSEAVPAHLLPLANITELKILGEAPHPLDPSTVGATILPLGNNLFPPVGHHIFNEIIHIFPGAYDDEPLSGTFTNGVDVETQALILEIRNQAQRDPALDTFAAQVYGRLIGETIAHEVIHSLLGYDIPPTGHNNPTINDDLMNDGVYRTFTQRTGYEDMAHQSPVDPVNFVDRGYAAINKLQQVNQGRMDSRFPVPPAFQ